MYSAEYDIGQIRRDNIEKDDIYIYTEYQTNIRRISNFYCTICHVDEAASKHSLNIKQLNSSQLL